ncbi:LOW QUALITY PROTEIN: uncharacterized protein LOC144739293 [Lampetra planeri]
MGQHSRGTLHLCAPAYFIINGLSGIPNMNYYYVFLFFVYVVSVMGNTVVMAVICLDCNLRTPKYIAVFNLAFVDLFGNSALVPKVLDIFLLNHRYIPYGNCLAFLFFCYTFLSMQSFNLVALSYDRLVAITYPLHYQVKVTHRFMFILITSFWVFVIVLVVIAVGPMTRLSFCKSVVINSYFCDHGQLYRLACNSHFPNYIPHRKVNRWSFLILLLGKNITFVRPAYFKVRGFIGIPHMKYYYVFLFVIYIVSLLGNTIVMAVIILDRNLKTPKYIVVFNMAFADLFSSTALVPKVLDIFLLGHHYISYNNCMTFMFFCFTSMAMQSLNLIVLSYDRMVAIKFPTALSREVSLSLILWIPLVLILLSYCYIGYTLTKISTAQQESKPLKTCTAHLLLVAIFFLPIIFVYRFSRVVHPNTRIINLSLTHVVPPMLNPIIYVLQTQEIRESVKKLLRISRQSKIMRKK